MSTRAQRRAEERNGIKDASKAQLIPMAAAPIQIETIKTEAEPSTNPVTAETEWPESSFERTTYSIADMAKADKENAFVLMAPSASTQSEPAVEPVLTPPASKGGPKTEHGKSISCLNAVKTGLTGRTVLLPSDDAEAYRHHVAQYFKEWKPGSEREKALVQSLADTDWRLDRVPGLEYGIFALGYIQFADMFPGEAPGMRKLLIEAHVLVVFEKQLRNLHLQHGRLCRQREKDQAELRQLKKERIEQERLTLEIAAKLYLKAKQDRKPFNAADHGFEFSIPDIEAFLDGIRASKIYNHDLANHPQAAMAA